MELINDLRYDRLHDIRDHKFIRCVRTEMKPGIRFVVQEKVRGKPACLYCDGRQVALGVDGAWLTGGGGLYNYGEMLDRYRRSLMGLYTHLRHVYGRVDYLLVYGEMFGGDYPHPEVLPDMSSVTLRRGVYYAPSHEFYAFDIYTALGDGGRYLSVSVCNNLLHNAGFFYARTLFQGALDDCMMHTDAFPTHIPEWLELPPLRNNICAGIVVRPETPLYLPDGDRVLLKSENVRFCKRMYAPRCAINHHLQLDPLTPECVDLMGEMEAMVSPKRLEGVLHREKELRMPRDEGRIIAQLGRDTLDDFFRRFGSRYDALAPGERHIITRRLNHAATILVRRELRGIS